MSESKKKSGTDTNKAIKEEEQAALQAVSAKLQVVLEAEGYGIQPFLAYSEFGISPRARLVKLETPINDEQATNTGDAGTDKEEAPTTEPTQS